MQPEASAVDNAAASSADNQPATPCRPSYKAILLSSTAASAAAAEPVTSVVATGADMAELHRPPTPRW
jgi:hypothetical protein